MAEARARCFHMLLTVQAQRSRAWCRRLCIARRQRRRLSLQWAPWLQHTCACRPNEAAQCHDTYIYMIPCLCVRPHLVPARDIHWTREATCAQLPVPHVSSIAVAFAHLVNDQRHDKVSASWITGRLPAGCAGGAAAGAGASSVQLPEAQSRLAFSRPAGMGAALGGHWLGISVLTGSLLTV